MKNTGTPRVQRGVTLVEVMVGTMVFFIAILAIFHAMPVLNRNAREARQRTFAALSARAMIEELKIKSASLSPGQYSFTPLEGTKAKLASYEIRQDEQITEIFVIVVWGGLEGHKIALATGVRKP